MSNLIDWESIVIDINYKPDIVLVTHGENASLHVELPISAITKGGARYITIQRSIFNEKKIEHIDMYEEEISTRLNLEQQTILYRTWSKDLNIKIGTTASVLGIEKKDAKEIIILGYRYGIFYVTNNNTWKIQDPEIIRSRWIDKAKQISQGPKIEKESITETIKRSLKEGVGSKAGSQIGGGMHSSSSGSNDGSSGGVSGVIKRKVKQPTEEQEQAPIEIIPREPIKRVVVNVEALREQLTKLQKQYDDPDFVEGVIEDRGTLRDKIKRLRVQITNAEIEETKNYFKGTKMTPSGSIMNITEEYSKKGKGMHVEVIESNRVSRQIEKQIIPKKKPAPTKGVSRKK
jgi:hypothetical protein